MNTSPVVTLRNVSKHFGSVQALRDVSIDLHAGRVHVLLGENGAGKSTLVKTILGTYHPDTGEILIRGRTVGHHSPGLARREGINVVMQDFSLAPTLTVLDNLFLGREPGRLGVVRRSRMRAKAREAMALVGATFSLNAEVGSLPRSEQQLVEIMKAVMGVPGVLVLDEPTAALSEGEADRLFSIVDRLVAQDWAVLYITHRMAEIRRLGHQVTVLRGGRQIASHLVADVTDDHLVNQMVGREVSNIYPAKADAATLGAEVLRLDRVSSANGKVRDLSLSVRAGEIVALAGLVGAGKGDVARVLSGLEPMAGGTVVANGYTTAHPRARRLIAHGVGYMSEDRKTESLALGLSVHDNLTLEAVSLPEHSRAGVLRLGALQRVSDDLIELLQIRPGDSRREVGLLSGGNQQKVVLGRALTRDRRLLIVAEPTSGVDVGARQQIYRTLRDLCANGTGILMVSSDLEEVVGLADRVYVMNSGSVTAELEGAAITAEAIVAGAFGHTAA